VCCEKSETDETIKNAFVICEINNDWNENSEYPRDIQDRITYDLR